jgi:hypothetical protein
METGQTTGIEIWSYFTATATTKSTAKVSVTKTLMTEEPREEKSSRGVL